HRGHREPERGEIALEDGLRLGRAAVAVPPQHVVGSVPVDVRVAPAGHQHYGSTLQRERYSCKHTPRGYTVDRSATPTGGERGGDVSEPATHEHDEHARHGHDHDHEATGPVAEDEQRAGADAAHAAHAAQADGADQADQADRAHEPHHGLETGDDHAAHGDHGPQGDPEHDAHAAHASQGPPDHRGHPGHGPQGAHEPGHGAEESHAHTGHPGDPSPPHPGVHPGHDHAGHGGVERFRRLFWILLVLAVPVVALSPMFAAVIGYTVPEGTTWVPRVLGTVVYAWGGAPFLTGAVSELQIGRAHV